MFTRINKLCLLSEYAKNDPDVKQNHISNGVVKDLKKELDETREVLGYVRDDTDYQFIHTLMDDIKTIKKALSVYN